MLARGIVNVIDGVSIDRSSLNLTFVSLHMTRIRAFQTLVVISIALFVVWFGLPYTQILYSPDTRWLLAYTGYGSAEWVNHPLFYISFGVVKLAAALGLFLFLSWGRWLFVVTVIATFVAVPFSGIGISTPLEIFISGVLWLIDGGILALAFTSPIAECWRKDET